MNPIVRFFLVAVAISASPLLAGGCAYTKAACKVIDTADAVCTVISFTGPDGKTQKVSVSRADLTDLGVRLAARRDGASQLAETVREESPRGRCPNP